MFIHVLRNYFYKNSRNVLINSNKCIFLGKIAKFEEKKNIAYNFNFYSNKYTLCYIFRTIVFLIRFIL